MMQTVKTFFDPPKTLDQARRQANILARAKTLFTTGGYSWYVSDTDPHLFGVCGPDGQHYGVNMRANSCTCEGFQSDKDCKHRIAVALSAEAYDASLCRQYDLFVQPYQD